MRFLVLFALALVLVPALAVPPGYRYVGSRVVSAARANMCATKLPPPGAIST